MEKAASRRSPASCTTFLSLAFGLSVALTACGGGGGGGEGPPVGPPAAPPPAGPVQPPTFSGLPDFAAAVGVVGQPGFTTGAANGGDPIPGGATLFDPAGVAVSPDGTLFISDAANQRLLGFRELPATLGQAADFVLGQPDMSSNGPIVGPDGFKPGAVSVGFGKVAVADRAHNRVLIYDAVPTDGTARPAVVVGQPTIEAGDPGCDKDSLSAPKGVHITPDGKLVVADTDNARVLIWKEVPTVDGAEADVVLGQAGFDSCDQNAGAGATPDRATLRLPSTVWSDGTRMAVADAGNNRVLLWDAVLMSLPTGQLPDRVLGQGNFTSASFATTGANTLMFPRGVSFNGEYLAVADPGNNRVLLWNEWPSQNGQPANIVIGQRNFLLSSRDDSNGDGTPDDAPSGQTLNAPFGVTFHQDKLLVIDESNNRLLIFKSP